MTEPEDRMTRIADAHSKAVDASGGTWGDCAECGWGWPCPTYRWATDDTLGVNCTWDPDECEFTEHGHRATS